MLRLLQSLEFKSNCGFQIGSRFFIAVVSSDRLTTVQKQPAIALT
ncbi:hypothetical protein [Synechococcus elongatus]|nr:hypothetical protein [Synechococcus elongatus]